MLSLDELSVDVPVQGGHGGQGGEGWLHVLDRLQLSLARGQTFALVGESGCGKSMTALALMRLLPGGAVVQGGQIRLDEQALLDLPESAMRRVRGGRIGMIFQEPGTSLNPVLRVGEQLLEAIETHTALRGEAARLKAIDWLRRVGIPEPERRIDDYPFRLSGGQKQRVMIAMALAAEPDYLIADEPTTALDVTIQRQVLDLLKDLQREQHLGLLLITHDLAVVAGMAHHVALMYAGQIVEVASAEAFFAAPRHPYARLLLQALPARGRPGGQLAAIAGSVPPLTQRFTACRFAPRCPSAQARCQEGEPALLALPGDADHALRCVMAPLVAPELSVAPAATSALSASTAVLPQPVLKVEHLGVAYPLPANVWARLRGEQAWFEAVKDVSFELHAGQTLALVGESGCGKTTTGRAVLQLLRGSARLTGAVRLDGADLCSLEGAALRAARAKIQMIFQDPFASLNPRWRVGEILEEGLRALRPELGTAARRQRILAMCDQVGLSEHVLARWPHEFSGGQRQRIAIARALVVEPRVLVCDEPTSALDVSVQAQILNLLSHLQEHTGIAMLLITHNIAVVEAVAQRIAVMQGGRIVESGTQTAVLDQPQQLYTQTLLAAVPRIAPSSQTNRS
ncbi:MAG: dipeptide ABC transporter ATP-binding protein [Leptothrix ochracea]|uniref:ABC transporter ATP-binding protein n=1 Tax=Leptothrix ochracea TaxID=735331 RepID=UPI0034E20139